MSGSQASSQNFDGGCARLRPRRRSSAAAATVVPRPVEKTYSTRLPVSGQEPPRLTKYERERLGRTA